MWNPPGCSSQNPANISLFDEAQGPNVPFSHSSSTPNYDPLLSELHNFDSDESVLLDLDRQTGNSEVWNKEKTQQDDFSQWIFDDEEDTQNTPMTFEKPQPRRKRARDRNSSDPLNSDRQNQNLEIWRLEEDDPVEFSHLSRQDSTDHRESYPKTFEEAEEELLRDFPDPFSSNSSVHIKMMIPPPPLQDFEPALNPIESYDEPMTTEKINGLLDRPLPENDLPTTKKIAEDLKKWLNIQGINIQRFAFCILGRKNCYYGLNKVRDWSEMKGERRKDYQRMFNWLGLTASYQNQIMDFMNENHGNLTSENKISSKNKRRLKEYFQKDEYPSSQKKAEIANELGILEYSVESYFHHLRRSRCRGPYTSCPQSSINRPKPSTAEEVKALLDAPISTTNRPTTEEIAQQMKSWFEYGKISVSYFSVHILGRKWDWNGIWRPYTWNTIKEQKTEDFIRMYNWLKIDENMKSGILEFVEANEGILKKVHYKEEMKKTLVECLWENKQPTSEKRALVAHGYGVPEDDVAEYWKKSWKRFCKDPGPNSPYSTQDFDQFQTPMPSSDRDPCSDWQNNPMNFEKAWDFSNYSSSNSESVDPQFQMPPPFSKDLYGSSST